MEEPCAEPRTRGRVVRVPHLITRPSVVVPVGLDTAGSSGPTPGQARGPRWRRVGSGLYVPAEVDPEALDQRIAEAVLGTPGTAAATGWAALAWEGGRWFSGLNADGTALPVPVALGDRRAVRPRPGMIVSEDWLFAGDLTEVDGLPLTIAERSVAYEARRARTLAAAVRVIDMAAYDDLVDVAAMRGYSARLAGRPGSVRLREAIDWADENVWSPQESVMRVAWRQAMPRVALRCNAPLFDADGQHLLTPDLLDVDHGVAGEYEGAVHLVSTTRHRDLDRDALYRDLGLEVVTMMSAEHDDLERFLARLRGAYRRAAEHQHEPRPWTAERPAWWVDTSSVAARRALTGGERAVWLGRRAS